jgi:phosphoheptose isomerase
MKKPTLRDYTRTNLIFYRVYVFKPENIFYMRNLLIKSLSSRDYSQYVNEALERTVRAHLDSEALSGIITRTAMSIIKTIHEGCKVLIIGNGGSASDASHMAAELVGRFRRNRPPLPAIALTTDTSLITAIANDFDYDQVFVRQCAALLKTGDILIAISTSGNSKNIIEAVRECEKFDSITKIALTGSPGGELARIADIPIRVPSEYTATIQEVHRTIIHIICDIVDDYYAQK